MTRPNIKIKASHLYSILEWCRNDGIHFRQLESIKEAHAFLIGYITAFNAMKTDSPGMHDCLWVSEFMLFCEKELLTELKKSEPTRISLRTGYANYIWENQANDDEGLTKFYKLLDSFVEKNEEPVEH